MVSEGGGGGGCACSILFFEQNFFSLARTVILFSHRAQIGGIHVRELNALELDFLFMMDFNLSLHPDLYNRCAAALLSFAAAPVHMCGPSKTLDRGPGVVDPGESRAKADPSSMEPTPSEQASSSTPSWPSSPCQPASN